MFKHSEIVFLPIVLR